MTDSDHELDSVTRVADELLPALTERLHRHGLGEIEISDGDLRLRVRAGSGQAATAAPAAPTAAATRATDPVTAATGDPETADPSVPVGSPAVGFFVYADGLGPGLDVASGDALGHVEMLGVRHEVRAPRTGTVRNLVAESGEAVEYGQVVVELQPEAGR